jgi:hypothetical protein
MKDGVITALYWEDPGRSIAVGSHASQILVVVRDSKGIEHYLLENTDYVTLGVTPRPAVNRGFIDRARVGSPVRFETIACGGVSLINQISLIG